MTQGFRIKVPASTSNLGPGFDTLGLALQLVNDVEVELSGKNLSIEVIGEGKNEVPENSRNLFIQALDLYLKSVGKKRPKGLRIRMINRIPLARGLGSSGATIIAGLLAGKKISGKDLSDHELLQLGLKLEVHPDNLVPALVGGLSLSIINEGKIVYLPLPVPLGLKTIAIVPEFKLSTKKARQILPKKVAFSDAVFNLGRSSFLTAALVAGRYDLMRLAVQDRLHQSYRFELAPKMRKIFDIASKMGGCGTIVSGAGPSVITFINHDEIPSDFVMGLSKELSAEKILAQIKILEIARQGALVEPIQA